MVVDSHLNSMLSFGLQTKFRATKMTNMTNRISTTVRVWDKARGDFVNLLATIDIDPVIIGAELGDKAFKNKSKASKIARGGVVLKIVTPVA